MDYGQTWMFQNGSYAEGKIGRFEPNENSGTVYVETDSVKDVGKHRTIIRGCSNYNELLEIQLYVDIIDNSYPDFASEVTTTWSLDVFQNVSYKLPALVDKEKNDEPDVYIRAMAEQPYPPFIMFNNVTREIYLRPDSIWY